MNNCYSLDNKIKYICNCNYNYFFNKKNVQGVALGYKIKNGFNTYKKCIKIFVSKKNSLNKLNFKDIIPKSFKGLLTDVVESGYFTSCSLTKKIRPVKGGYGISRRLALQVGTAGCLVTNGKLNFILSSNHVLANCNRTIPGTDIIQPPYLYGGESPKDNVGTLSKFIPLRIIQGRTQPVNLSDCAIALLTEPNILSSEIALIGKPLCVKNPRLNESVKKVGAITELTEGTITNISGTFIVTYPSGERYLFKDIIITTSMSNYGDSGSLLVNKNMCALGLLFSQSGNGTLYCKLNTVLDQLDVQLVTK